MVSSAGTRRRLSAKGLGINVLLALVSFLLSFFVVEIAVRVAGVGSDQLLRPDPILGVRFIESKTGLSQDTCFRANVTINGDGWRSPAVSPTKPEGVYRILVLGDSFMAGLQVQDNETFARVLEEQLNEVVVGRRVEVINFGVPSWGTDQEYLALREYGLRLKPDLVLMAFYGQNDVGETDPVIRSSTSTYSKPYFNVKDGQLVELPFSDSTRLPIRIARRLAAPFRTYPLTRDALLTIPVAHQLMYRLGIVGVVPIQRDSDEPGGSTVWQWPDRWRRQLGVFEREPWADWNHAWAIIEALLRQIRSDVTRAGASFLVINVSSPIEVMPSSLLSGLLGEGNEDQIDVDKPWTLLAQIAHRQGIDVASMVPGFRARIGDSVAMFGNYFLDCDGHWTAAGHRLAADLAATEIAARIAKASP